MPGIVGLITTMPRLRAMEALQRMLATMRHESFYLEGVYECEAAGVYLGWTERDRSSTPNGLFVSPGRDVAMAFCGQDSSGVIASASSAEDGVRCIDALDSFGDDDRFQSLVRQLNGIFHGVVVREKDRSVGVFTDRWGMGRVYLHRCDEGVYIASEAKALLEVKPALRVLDSDSVPEFLTLGCTLSGRSLFKGIEILPGGTILRFESGREIGERRYFSPEEWEAQSILDAPSFYEGLRSIFEDRVHAYAEPSRYVGLSLTGGLDTRAVLAWLKADRGTLPCYTFAGSYRECADVKIARKVAEYCNQPYSTIGVDKEYLKDFGGYAERTIYLSDGCCPIQHAADLYVNQLARQIAPIRLTGNYGDQMLRQMSVMKVIAPDHHLFAADIADGMLVVGERLQELKQVHKLTFAAFRQAPWHYYGLMALENSQVEMRTPFMDNELVKHLFRAPEEVLKNNDLRVRLIADGDAGLARIRTDLGFAGSGGKWIEDLMSKKQLFTMRVEYAWDYGMPAWLAKWDHALSDLHLERLFLGHHKFTHYRVWYRDQLGAYIRETLLSERALSRSYLDRRVVQRTVEGHLQGKLNATVAIHKLLGLELINRLFVDGR